MSTKRPSKPVNDYFDPFKSMQPQPIGKCSECGRDYYATEWYSCPEQKCPIQPKVTF